MDNNRSLRTRICGHEATVIVDANVKVNSNEEGSLLIGELASRTGVSARSIRHYEEKQLLVPRRDSNGYRRYDESDVIVIEHVRIMIAAGLTTEVISRFLDCNRPDASEPAVKMCPDLEAELARTAVRLRRQRTAIEETERQLAALTA